MSSNTLTLSARPPRRRRIVAPVVPALVYHKVAEIPPHAKYRCNYVTPARFSTQLAYLRAAGYESISFAEYLAYRRGVGALPARPVLITFDDGYKSNRDIAWPLLRRYGFSATIFVVPGLLGDTNRWDGDEIQEPLLTHRDVRAMRAEGIEFQSHTLTHQRLPELSASDALHELRESRLQLEDVIDDAVTVVAYPWGDSDDDVQRLAIEAGYAAGAIVRRRTNFDSTPLFELRRIGINEDTSLARFGWDLARLRLRGA